jgi:hypothetical protein
LNDVVVTGLGLLLGEAVGARERGRKSREQAEFVHLQLRGKVIAGEGRALEADYAVMGPANRVEASNDEVRRNGLGMNVMRERSTEASPPAVNRGHHAVGE